MRVCLTVQGEQPRISDTARMLRGGPRTTPEGPGMAGCWRTNGPGCPEQCPEQHCSRESGEKGRKCGGLGTCPTGVFGAE